MTPQPVYHRIFFSLAALALVAATAQAENTALRAFTSGAATNNTSTVEGTTTVGWGFTALANLSVTSLGFLHTYPDDPLAITHQVAIWDSHSNIVVQATIPLPTIGTPTNSFSYVAVAPTALAYGEIYFIGAQIEPVATGDLAAYLLTDGRYWFNVSGSVFSPEIGSAFPARSEWNAGFVFPEVINTGGEGRYGPNFTYEVTSVVPEPSTVALWFSALATVFVLWRPRAPRP